MANRVFLFHDTTDNFRAFEFDSTAVAAENWSPGFGTIGGATADYAHIYVLDISVNPAIVRVFNASQVRQSLMDITMNSGDTYAGIAVTDTHLVAVNQTRHRLEYYDINTRVYDSTKDVTLPSTATSIFRAICQADNKFFIVRGGTDDADRRIYSRNLDGTAVTDWSLPSGTNHDTLFATDTRVVAIRRATGHGDQYQFDGTADTVLGPFGAGTWVGSYSTFELAEVAITSSYNAIQNQYQVNFVWTGGHGDFAQDDITLSHGTINSFSHVSGSTYQIGITPPSAGMGTIVLTIRKDAVTEKNAEITYTVGTFDNMGPPPLVTIPGMQENLTVTFPTATSALLQWDRPSSGIIDVDTYEVSVAAGSSPGTNYVATGNTRTRHLVTGLQRGTQYTFAVRGRNADGVGPASAPVTENTPIASMHNALFFKECVNYFDDGARVSEHGNPSNIIREVADNNYQTFTTEKDLSINIAVGGNPTRVDAIFVKGMGIERHSAVPTGGLGSGYSNRQMPATVRNWEGTEVSTVVNGFQHDLYLLDQHFTATSVRMTFTGAGAKIVEVMLLEFGIEIDANGDFTEIAANFVDREGIIHSDPSGGIIYDSPIGNERDKWEVDYVLRVVPGKTLLETPEEFLYWRSENRNHIFCMEPSRFPWRVFPAVFVRKSVPVRYRTDDKTGGEILSFRVSEQ